MIRPIEPTNFLRQSTLNPIIDVRSPAEYAQGHIPGAFNIPLFDDKERAELGTLYVQAGREDAVLRGLDFAVPRTDWYLDSLRRIQSKGRILVHCWRGGMRSAAMAELFSKAGYEVDLLTGGYKAYRRHIREYLGRPARIVVVGGLTGTGKTGLLHAISKMGEQVVDLEGLACHKGSVFGALGQPAQPTNEQFENNLYARWSQLDLSRLVWLEDESRMIGKVTLPDPVVAHITNGCLLIVEPGHETRIRRLVDEYAGFDKALLAEAINRIADRLGGANAKEAVIALENDCFEKVVAIVLAYYDKAYLFSIGRRKSKNVHNIPIQGSDPESDARRIIELAYKCASDGNDLSRL